jgi:hypothetical protein
LQGEIQAIGFDTNEVISPEYTFQLYGTQSWGRGDFRDYASSAPEWKHNRIPVGQFYTGSFSYLFFANDHDASNADAEGYFSNISVYELEATPDGYPTIDNQSATPAAISDVGMLSTTESFDATFVGADADGSLLKFEAPPFSELQADDSSDQADQSADVALLATVLSIGEELDGQSADLASGAEALAVLITRAQSLLATDLNSEKSHNDAVEQVLDELDDLMLALRLES